MGKAVDGNSNNGVYVDSPSGVCAHTLGGNSWITLDLHSSHEIDHMEFVGRRGSCAGCYLQSSGWDIHIGNSGTSADPLCKSSVDVSGGDVSTVTCDSALTGHYITITSSNAMVLCEVDVYGRRNMPTFIKDCRWESNHDQTPNSANYMGWTCADNEILTGFGLSANQHDVTKVQCCKLAGHSSVKPNTCTYVDSNHERAKCGNGNDHLVFSGAYDKRASTVDAVTEILAGKCCEVECDSAWCAGKDWGVDKNNCQVISTSNTNAQELVCPEGTLLTEVEDGLTGNAHGVQKVASVTCCALDLIAPPSMAPSAAPTTARPTSAPTGAPSTSMPTSAPTGAPSTSMPALAPTSVEDCLLGLRDPQDTDSEFLSGIDRCLPGCRSPSRAPTALHRRALESRLLSENNRRQ